MSAEPTRSKIEPQGAASRSAPEFGRRAVTYPYRRIALLPPTPADGPDSYGSEDPRWLEIDWRPHLHWIELEGTPINYAEIGEGPAIVFVHGLGGCWQNWLENMPYFADNGYRAIALDLPGFGHSPMPDWPITIPAYGRLIDEFCRRLNLHSATLIGNSMGGFIAAETAIGEPDWIDHLVLVAAAGISHATMQRRPVAAMTRAFNLLNPLTLRLNDAGVRRPGVRQLAFQGVFRHPQRIRRELLCEFTSSAIGAPAFIPAVLSLTGYDFLHRLGRIVVPTLAIWGRDDLVVPAADAAGFRDRIVDCELHVFDDCGHVPMAERPERFNRVVADFLERR